MVLCRFRLTRPAKCSANSWRSYVLAFIENEAGKRQRSLACREKEGGAYAALVMLAV